MDLLMTSASGMDCLVCAIAKLPRTLIHTKLRTLFEANFIGILRLFDCQFETRAVGEWQQRDFTTDFIPADRIARVSGAPRLEASSRLRILRFRAHFAAGLKLVGHPKYDKG